MTLHRFIDRDSQMTPIDFQVTRAERSTNVREKTKKEAKVPMGLSMAIGARRQQQWHFDAFLTRELCNKDINHFQNSLRMPPELFNEMLERISQVISR
ncbi:hypothetical protein DPMN_059389 [Dreissena polymorpha]|uniref:Uncharacterized protein n=1 Tax=Dreissena polymorpha TaxID=45954 RepID=A0A9D4C3F0_DREPO|nr:hypothetical protein DPMN_059389 [Dreissena polymorpha]